MKHISFIIFILGLQYALAQHDNTIIASMDMVDGFMHVEQSITVVNHSNDTWNHIMLLDWAHAFNNTDTPLAKRFAEDFKNRFQFSSDNDKGKTIITSSTYDGYSIERLPTQSDIIKVNLDQALNPNESIKINFTYSMKIPEDDFTGYGHTSNGDFNLKYWHLSPAVYNDGKWQHYSHKGINDFFPALMNHRISLHVPSSHQVITNAKITTAVSQSDRNSYFIEATNYPEIRLHIQQDITKFKSYGVPNLKVITDISDDKVPLELKALMIDRITGFLKERLGEYPYEQMLISERYYKENPVYGLSSLPSFLNPFPSGFTWEIKLLKSMTRQWINAGPRLNPRQDYWLYDGMMVYLIKNYHDQYYKNLKITGKLGDIWGIKSFNLTQVNFTDQYRILYENTARLNLDEALNTSSDSLVKYNQQLAIANKAAAGLQYLNDYSKNNVVTQVLKEFYQQYQLKIANSNDFKKLISSKSGANSDWFFNDYVTKHTRIDWKIKKTILKTDSVQIVLKNKSDRNLPLPVYLLKGDSIVSKKWIHGFQGDTLITLSRKHADRIAINHEHIIPEFSMRDNYKTLKKFAFNRPPEFRLFKDIEDPQRSQVFVMPEFGFNIYDGVTLGARFNNGTLLPKPFRYSLKPTYGTNSQKTVGSASFTYTHYLEGRSDELFAIRYGISGNRFSYADNLMYRRATGFFNLLFRPKDLRSNKRKFLTLRNVLVDRDRDPANPVNEPDYNVFTINYGMSDPNFTRLFSYNIGAEISPKFGKVTFRTQWRKLFKDSRQLNVRFFTGAFLYNDTQNDGNFFSFALDRPTDYLFDYDYYGRSEDSGLFSQQLIITEGGFKSQLDTAFANQFISTINTSYSIWKYIFIYADIGLIKNKNQPLTGVYDSGLRLNLLQDYFELYFPIYSSNGWEIGQNDYDQRIRFIVTLDLRTLTKLFTRRWY